MRYLILFVILISFGWAADPLTPVWVEAAPDGVSLARVVIPEGSHCPSISVDNAAPVAMQMRLPVPLHFQPICEFQIPHGTIRASVAGRNLALAVDNPSRVAVIGDTGCRIKGNRIQACNDASVWPFATVAARTASAKPQLVIHVGDYLYRESPCPPDQQSQCGGSPSGDNWGAWKADFFTPAAPLLAAAPWAFSRGNHESCARSYRGWFYYLDPRPFSEACPDYSEPYLITLGAFQLLMVDTSAAKDANADPKQVEQYTALLKPFASANGWLVEHHPMWGVKHEGDDKADAPLTAVMQQAYEAAGLSNIGLILAGHTHLFEVLSYATGRPPQIVAGDAGTTLAGKVAKDLKGESVFGAQVTSGASRHEFGYTMLEKKKKNSSWDLKLRNPAGKTLAECKIDGKAVQCKGSK